ncbi:sugar ABC transporter permease [Vallitalea guaymasensis]|uniref:Sugar ABC transporter permease n=1 Tax=Vallitalea guaymasensis TaxID=1185412 RepID=A0A8J8SC19_9FIRM|nr:sugar ABC transporter permease [Vallitalea guaymasensis]QUH29229.1 sugar ABC transporter permease [Vallitalea guaymasensis]
MHRRTKHRIKMSLLNLFFIVACLLCIVPILYTLSVSLNGTNNILSGSFSFVPKEFTLDNYKAVLFNKPYLLWLKNTLILVVATVTISLAVAIPAAYAFSRFRFIGRKTILYILIILNAFPSILSMFAIYRILMPMKLVNSYLGLILIYVGTMAIFGLWNMKGYFDTIPIEIEEAGKIDGANDFQLVTKLILPLAKPSIIVTAVMIIIFVWNEYIFAVTFMTGAEKYTLAAGLYALQATQYTRNWPIFSAASLLTAIPILIIFLVIQRNMVSGLTAGGVKG